MPARVLDGIAAHPWLIAACATLLTLMALGRLVDFERWRSRLAIDPSIEALLPRDGEALEVYERTRARFGTDDVLLLAWLADDLFTPKRLGALKRFTRRIERLAGVDKVDSLASALNVRISDDSTEVDAFLHELPVDRAAAERLRAEAITNPLYVGRLVSKDGRGALVAVHFDPELAAPALVNLVHEIAATSRDEADGATQLVTGPLVVRLEISRILLRDLYRVMPLAVLGTLLVAAFAFRSLRGVLVPLLANGVALIGTLACFVEAGHALNFVTVILPPVVYVVGFAYAVHVVSSFDQEYARRGDKVEAVRTALREVFVPLTLTGFTTAVGFASLAISDITSIRQFGLYATLGTVVAWASALTIAPAGLMILPAGRRARIMPDLLATLAPRIAQFDLAHRRLLLTGGAVLAAASLVAASRIEVSTDYLRNFPEDSPIRRDFARIGSAFAGAVPLQILLESDVPQAFKDPAQLRIIADLEEWLLAQPEIGGVYTLADYIGILHRALAPELAKDDRIPRSAALVDHLLLLGGSDDVERFADSRYTSTLLHVGCTAVSTAELAALTARIDAKLAELPAHLRGQVTGSSYLIASTIDDISRGQVASLGFALGIIYLVLAGLFGSFRVAGLALLPNALPILVYFGILGAGSITLNLTTSLIASVVLGIAVDETIHFLSQFNIEARRIANEQIGVARALSAVIRPATFTTASLCVGFLALTAGELHNQVEFGVLAAATLFIAWLLYLTLTPALSERLRVVTLWEVLTVDLGAAPHKTIPLFDGLTQRQARIAALMGTIEWYAEGTRVLRFGDPGGDICVVIDGKLVASVPEEGGDKELRTLSRGALIGEVALLLGNRTANVDALSAVRVLRFTEGAFPHILHRYPRIGAVLYRNLATVLAVRLADLTKRLAELGVSPEEATHA